MTVRSPNTRCMKRVARLGMMPPAGRFHRGGWYWHPNRSRIQFIHSRVCVSYHACIIRRSYFFFCRHNAAVFYKSVVDHTRNFYPVYRQAKGASQCGSCSRGWGFGRRLPAHSKLLCLRAREGSSSLRRSTLVRWQESVRIRRDAKGSRASAQVEHQRLLPPLWRGKSAI